MICYDFYSDYIVFSASSSTAFSFSPTIFPLYLPYDVNMTTPSNSPPIIWIREHGKLSKKSPCQSVGLDYMRGWTYIFDFNENETDVYLQIIFQFLHKTLNFWLSVDSIASNSQVANLVVGQTSQFLAKILRRWQKIKNLACYVNYWSACYSHFC